MKLTYIRLLVSDFDACFRFYRDVMGLEASWGAEGESYADFKTGADTGIALFERGAMSEELGTAHLPAPEQAQDRAALIFGVADLDAEVERLRARGATFVVGPTDHPDWGIRTAHLRDPDGNLIEINSSMPQEEWTENLRAEGEKYNG